MEWPTSGSVLRRFVFDPTIPYTDGQHRGIDVSGAIGSSIVAPTSGTVVFAGTVPSRRKAVTIATDDGLAVSLTQLGSIVVTRGMRVAAREVIGSIGPSGDTASPRPHVHLSVRAASNKRDYLDPEGFLARRAPSGPLERPHARNDSRRWLALLIAASTTVAALAYTDVHTPARVLLVPAFLLVFPGMAWVRLLRIFERTMTVILAISLSIVVDTAVPGTLVYAGGWSAGAALAIVLAVTLAGGLCEAFLAERLLVRGET
jgi:Peptidase family M23